MEQLMAKLCFGDKNGNSDGMCYEDQFLVGGLTNKFQGLLTDDVHSRTSMEELSCLIMIPSLHGQSSINIYAGKGLIEKGLLARKSLLNASTASYYQWEDLAVIGKEVLCNCKKMIALVMAHHSPYKDGSSFPSGGSN
ncbi:hypothetical protein MHU86_14752 [Fragilaria crotonensis]|nr:hypothetical protein MHU86_20655 [Fragilaria crotonensis]KAI2499740.1 hypothetical protein MHU86_14752 [Fragilaria crotonensis]